MIDRAVFEQEYRELASGCALCDLGALQPGLIEFTGKDHLDWLQGQVSNDLRGLEAGTSIDFCILKPTGQIVAPCRLWRFEDRSLLETPLACVPAVLERAEAMVVMEDVSVRNLTDSYRLLSFQGPRTPTPDTTALSGGPKGRAVEAKGEALEPAAPMFRSPEGASFRPNDRLDRGVEGSIALKSDHTGFGGLDIWVPMGIEFSILEWFEPKASSSAVDAVRLEAGIPIYGIDMNDRTLPPEMGPAFEKRNVSYSKGCYVGQEVLARIHSRGHTNKTWMALRCEEEVQAGSDVLDGAGKVSSVSWSPKFGWIAGATLKNEKAVPGQIVFVDCPESQVRAKVAHFPLR